MISGFFSFVASKICLERPLIRELQAFFWRQRHNWSPAFNPGNPYAESVSMRSFPEILKTAKTLQSSTAHDRICSKIHLGPVRNNQFDNIPVKGSLLPRLICCPKTFNSVHFYVVFSINPAQIAKLDWTYNQFEPTHPFRPHIARSGMQESIWINVDWQV